MKCRRWISANSQEIISEKAAFHYWQSGKSKEIKQMVYFSKISEEVGAVLCRGWLWIWDLSRDFYLLVWQHLHSMGLVGLMLGVSCFFLVPGPAKAVGVAWVPPLASGKHGVCTAFSVSWQLLPWVPLQGSPEGSLPSPWAILEINPWAKWARIGNYDTSGVKAGLTRSTGMGSGRGTAQRQKKTRKLFLLWTLWQSEITERWNMGPDL